MRKLRWNISAGAVLLFALFYFVDSVGFVAALVPAAAVGALNMIRLLRSGGVNTRSVLIAAAFAALAYAGCFIALECFRAAYDRRLAKLDSVEEEEE